MKKKSYWLVSGLMPASKSSQVVELIVERGVRLVVDGLSNKEGQLVSILARSRHTHSALGGGGREEGGKLDN